MDKTFYTIKPQLVDQISFFEYIPLKAKVKSIDIHPNLPWIAFLDLENNLLVFDVPDKKPVQVINFQNYFLEQIVARDISFFNTNDKQYLNNLELSDIKKIKGIPFSVRSFLVIVTTEKQVVFFNYMTKTIVKTLQPSELDGKPAIKCDVYNFKYLVILTAEGNLIIWDSIEWTSIQTLNKNTLQKSITNFLVITTKQEETLLVVANSAGNLFSLDLQKQNYAITRLNSDKNSHETNIATIDFNPNTNQVVSFSKNYILVFDLKDPNKFLKIPNFHYVKTSKGEGIISVLNGNFNSYSCLMWGKDNSFISLELNLEFFKDRNRKIESKEVKPYISNVYDIDTHYTSNNKDKQSKIYVLKILYHVFDFLVLGTNKGVVVFKFNPDFKPSLSALSSLIEINDKCLIFYHLSGNGLYEQAFTLTNSKNQIAKYTHRTSLIQSRLFEHNKSAISFFSKYDMSFSFNNEFIAVVDVSNEGFSIHQLAITNEFRYQTTQIRSGMCCEFKWCPFDNIFAIVKKNTTGVADFNKGGAFPGKTLPKFSFCLNVNAIKDDGKVEVLYIIDDLPCHRLFGFHYLGVMCNFTFNNFGIMGSDNSSILALSSNLSYSAGTTTLKCYKWTEKKQVSLNIMEEPKQILTSSDLKFLIVIFPDKYSIYSLDAESLTCQGIFYFKIKDGYIYEDFILTFLTDRGVYFQVLGDETTFYPIKLLKLSEAMNPIQIKLSKKYRENTHFYSKKLFPHKILGIFNRRFIFSNSINEVEIKECDHIIFKIIDTILSKNLNDLKLYFTHIEKKYTKPVLVVLDHYFPKMEELYRKIFSDREIVNTLKLYDEFDWFAFDEKTMNILDKKRMDKLYKEVLYKYLEDRRCQDILNLQRICGNTGNNMEVFVSKYIDEKAFLMSLLNNQRHFESYNFNEIYKVTNQINTDVLTTAYDMINKSKNR